MSLNHFFTEEILFKIRWRKVS